MARVVIASSADADYAEILTDLAAKAGWRNGRQIRRAFRRALRSPRRSSALRRAPSRARSDIRIGIVTPFIVIYRNDDDGNTVTVLRIVHGRRRVTGRMLVSA